MGTVTIYLILVFAEVMLVCVDLGSIKRRDYLGFGRGLDIYLSLSFVI